MKKIIIDKNIYWIGGKHKDKYYLLFDNQKSLEVSRDEWDKCQIGDEYSLSHDQEQNLFKYEKNNTED
jgi:hypothetical protein